MLWGGGGGGAPDVFCIISEGGNKVNRLVLCLCEVNFRTKTSGFCSPVGSFKKVYITNVFDRKVKESKTWHCIKGGPVSLQWSASHLAVERIWCSFNLHLWVRGFILWKLNLTLEIFSHQLQWFLFSRNDNSSGVIYCPVDTSQFHLQPLFQDSFQCPYIPCSSHSPRNHLDHPAWGPMNPDRGSAHRYHTKWHIATSRTKQNALF